MAYADQKPFPIGRVGITRAGKPKDVLSHDPESYSKHYTKNDHAEAAQVHLRRAIDHKNAGRKEQHEHHMKMHDWHHERSQL